MRYNSLKVAIPREIKKVIMLTDHQQGSAINFMQIMVKRKNLSQLAYLALLEKPSYDLKIMRWQVELNKVINEEIFMRCFRDLYITTNITKYRSFQYRLLHRAIITNVQLYKWKKSDNKLFVRKMMKCMHTYLYIAR